jgi:dipeptidase E
MKNPNILLISSSVVHGGSYLDYAEAEIRDHLSHTRSVLFVPYALKDRDGYTAKVQSYFEARGYQLQSIHRFADPKEAVRNTQAIFIGGGNTFRLLKQLQDLELIAEIRERVRDGMSYMGSSAGTNVACPTIRTTNDMPILEPQSLRALGLVPFQINPHYVDPDPNSKHMGETREERIREFLEENDLPVIGLREGAMIRIQGEQIVLKGIAGARLFRAGAQAEEISPGTALESRLPAR